MRGSRRQTIEDGGEGKMEACGGIEMAKGRAGGVQIGQIVDWDRTGGRFDVKFRDRTEFRDRTSLGMGRSLGTCGLT